MREAWEEFVETSGDISLGAKFQWIDNTLLDIDQTLSLVTDWVEERFAGKDPDLFLSYSWDSIDETIKGLTLKVHGAVPGSSVSVYLGQSKGLDPGTGCSGQDLQIQSPQYGGEALASAAGKAVIPLSFSGSQKGKLWFFQAADHKHCMVSNLLIVSAH